MGVGDVAGSRDGWMEANGTKTARNELRLAPRIDRAAKVRKLDAVQVWVVDVAHGG